MTCCEACGKPDPSEAIAQQQEAMKPRHVVEWRAVVAKPDAFLSVLGADVPDIRMGDIVSVTLIATAVPDITAGVYCECDEFVSEKAPLAG